MAVENSLHTLLDRLYGIRAQLTVLPGERDLNYLATTTDGERYICKLMHAGCEQAVVELQIAALDHLDKSSLLLPRVVRSASGAALVSAQIGTETRILWLLHYCPGELLADYRPHTGPLYESFGKTMAQLCRELEGFRHPAMRRDHCWDLTRADEHLLKVNAVSEDYREAARRALECFAAETSPRLSGLAQGVIHNDANDYNVLVTSDKGAALVTGLFDFGDTSWQPLICDAAIALAYLILDQEDPLSVCASFLRGYCTLRQPSAAEISLLFGLIQARLAVSLVISSDREQEEPEDPYVTISQGPAGAALNRLQSIPTRFAECVFRDACALPVLPGIESVTAALETMGAEAAPVVKSDSQPAVIDLSVDSPLLGSDPANHRLGPLATLINHSMAASGASVAYGRYAEPRALYTDAAFGGDRYPTQERRTEHIGLDIFCPPGTAVQAPLAGTIECIAHNQAPLDYGPLVILRHVTTAQEPFYTLYGHLSLASINGLHTGQTVRPGERFAEVGDSHENGGWPPHLHLQIMIDLLGLDAEFPGVVSPTHAHIWRQLCPCPAALIPGAPLDRLDARADSKPTVNQLLKRRERLLGPSLRLSYRKPLHLVSGFRQFLYDSQARAYLDAYNNVAHVGHSHPRVVAAIQRQTALLNTNTRYLHENILDYAERLNATFPAPLSTCLFVNSASEANELALRLARNYTGRHDVCVMEAAYHGHTNTLTAISPYKYDGPGGGGRPDWVHEVPLADDYRGLFRRDDPQAGLRYAQCVNSTLSRASANGRDVAAFITETIPSVGGQIVFPQGYLAAAYRHARCHGTLCIADEVQVGFGRMGSSFWGFEQEDAIPDIVVLGKPIANGYPLGAVITRAEIAASLDNGMEFFSTYGGNPVACAAGLAVLDILDEESLQANALARGEQLISGLEKLKHKHPLIGDVRGRGLFLGVELVRDANTLEPAGSETDYVVNRLRDCRILAGSDGPHHNVIKLRPPMIFTAQDADVLLTTLDRIFQETPLKKALLR